MTMKTTTTMMAMLLLMMMMLPSSAAEVFSSMMKLQQLAKFEREMLLWMLERGHTDSQEIQRFLNTRLTMRNSYDHVTMHPNTVFLLVKAFLENWKDLFQGVQLMQTEVKMRAELPEKDDLKGCMASLLLLQCTYNVSARQVYSGNISWYLGPALTVADAVDLGVQAFYTHQLWGSSGWLELAREEIDRSVQSQVVWNLTRLKETVLSLLGRIANMKGDIKKAHALLREATELTVDKPSPYRRSLEKDISHPQRHANYRHLFRDLIPPAFRHLCGRDRDQTVARLRPFHVCRYKPSFRVPYLLYKEEVLSQQPHMSLFHDVISDTEIAALKALSSTKLKRSKVTDPDGKNKPSHLRTGQHYFTYESQSELTARLTRRISDVTWLLVRHKVINTTTDNTDTTDPDTTNTTDPDTTKTTGSDATSSTEAEGTSDGLQVLNYGLGGFYSYHYDESNDENKMTAQNLRVATFMIYLSEPEIGGHTIFPAVNISIAPVQGMAVFWYNLTPSGDLDDSTIHSGCPVLKGNKWIVNQWIRSHANLFRRPCGLTPHCDQQHVDIVMDSRRLHPLTPP